MSAHRRIIPVCSGKGGVGKTTFALNYALSLAEHGPTLLVDLDTGTSSLRACLDTPIERDLYHFLRKGYPLGDCVTRLSPRLDPHGRYSRFGFVASPRHLIEEITNLSAARREQMVDAINGLDARFVVLDLRAGLDAGVIDFLPSSNSGVLLFTPHLPAATLAAADVVKAVLFRKLRALFAPGSPVYARLTGLGPDVVAGMIDSAEDVYEEGTANLDAFAAELARAVGARHPVVALVERTLGVFVVHFVLNMFNGVRASYDAAVKPFAESLAETVSERLDLVNLGWIVAHDDIQRAAASRVPALLYTEERAAPRRPDRAQAELAELATRYLGDGARRHRGPAVTHTRPDPTSYLEVQLDSMTRMFEDLRGADFRENFRYVAHRSLHVMRSRAVWELGDQRLLKRSELQSTLLARLEATTPG